MGYNVMFVSASILIIFPCHLLYILWKNYSKDELEQESFIKFMGFLYDQVKIGDRMTLGFHLFVYIRRLLFIAILAYLTQLR